MAGFEKVKLASGEFRGDYIQRRLKEGASIKDIASEINAPGLYSGPEGKSWPETVIYAEKRRLNPVVKAPTAVKAVETAEVPEEYVGILTPEDMAAIRAEALDKIKTKQRGAARKEALQKATIELERQAREADMQGAAKGDLVDVHIDLAQYAPNIRLDGRAFEHGRMYRVTRKVAAVLAEQMQRSWQHQDSLSGANENAYRRPRNATMSMRTGATTGTHGLRV